MSSSDRIDGVRRSSRRLRQTTLFENKKTPIQKRKGQEENEKANKRVKTEDDDTAIAIGIATTTDVTKLTPITNRTFLDAYRVKGLEDVYYKPDWITASEAHAWRRELDALLEWYRPTLKVYGKEIRQSRSIAAFATAPGLALRYSGHDVEMHHPFPPLLERIAARLANDGCLGANVQFNHAMLNRYEDGSVYIGRHSDNVENKVIVTVSLGAERTWIMEEKVPRKSIVKGNRWKWKLGNGSLVVMQGDAQRRYTHEIPKETLIKQPRISITFRQLVY